MSKITQAFKGKKCFIAFVTGGDPDLETTEKIILALVEAGADIVEIGIPFSDPIAEGPVIQSADERALKAGTTTDKLFELVKKLRENVTVPLVFMTYLNPVFTYGKDKFLSNCAKAGVDGIIVPDMPFEEKGELDADCARHNVDLISMIAPTSDVRAEIIAKEAQGFLYCVSSMGVTGMRSSLGSGAKAMVERVRAVSSVPCAVGFGVSTPAQAAETAQFADGVIIGSAIVNIIAEHGRQSPSKVREFAEGIRRAINRS